MRQDFHERMVQRSARVIWHFNNVNPLHGQGFPSETRIVKSTKMNFGSEQHDSAVVRNGLVSLQGPMIGVPYSQMWVTRCTAGTEAFYDPLPQNIAVDLEPAEFHPQLLSKESRANARD